MYAYPLQSAGNDSRGTYCFVTHGRVIEAYVSAQYLNHVISFGKQDDWLGPGVGGGMAYSNNAENIYSIRINRIEPLHIPLLSKLTGPFRYEFYGRAPLKGHTLSQRSVGACRETKLQARREISNSASSAP